jgi:superfamily I DNA/RNA helicase
VAEYTRATTIEDCYLTFTTAAARDGERRLHEAFLAAKQTAGTEPSHPHPIDLDARTLHSCAYRLLQEHKRERQNNQAQEAAETQQPWSDDKLRTWLAKVCEKEIEAFLQPCIAQLSRNNSRSSNSINNMNNRFRLSMADQKRRAKEQVVFFLHKSLMLFCQSPWTLQEYMPPRGIRAPFGRDYYPAVLFHNDNGKGNSYGFDSRVYKPKVAFYAEQIVRVWNECIVSDPKIRTFDFEMKQAQLLKLRIPCNLLLVDEAQDMDGCQMKWIGDQRNFGIHVYIVGDPAQAIYGFRGAKSKYLMDLNSSHDCFLTESWRFGRRISQIANLVLFAKEHSDQTAFDFQGKPKNWISCRTRAGDEQKEGLVTSASIVDQWRTLPGGMTLIAKVNATLLVESLKAIGFDVMNHDSSSSLNAPLDCPKIHINGRGESSGLRLWKKTFKTINSIYDLYKFSKDNPLSQMQLDRSIFPDFVGRQMTWNILVDECTEKELGKYQNGIHVVSMLGDRTVEGLDAFKATVIEKNYSVEEADIIVTTCHSAKGMEWDNVQVCDDFIGLCQYQEKAGVQPAQNNFFSLKRPRQPSVPWKFAFRDWGDDVNLVYVACTRASRLLSIPPGVASVLASFDKLHQWRQHKQQQNQHVPSVQPFQMDGCKEPLVPTGALELYTELAHPLRKEWGLLQHPHDDQLLSDIILEHSNRKVLTKAPTASSSSIIGSNDFGDESLADDMNSSDNTIAADNQNLLQ